ncbi:transposase [Succinatimonas hippei]|uniref:transposase n=1 Tax=Succinatimonas hippei TaxID=626938 RepID=UPI003C700233
MNQVIAAKYRRKVFTARIITQLKTIFAPVCPQLNAGLIEFRGEKKTCFSIESLPTATCDFNPRI